MKKISITIVILFLTSNIRAQQLTALIENKEETTTLFDYGQPLNTTESNFKNLFRNFPRFVSNSGEGLKLLSYKYITKIKGEKQIKLYVDKNIKVYQSGGSIVSVFGGNDIKNNSIKLVYPQARGINKRTDLIWSKQTRDSLQQVIKGINLDDEVYLVKFIANGIVYDFYMFANPRTKNVIKKGNFLAFAIPLYYADYYSRTE